jgi:hypothetical protein
MQSKIIELNASDIDTVVGGLAIKAPPQPKPPALPTGMNGQNARPSAPTSTQSVSVSASMSALAFG